MATGFESLNEYDTKYKKSSTLENKRNILMHNMQNWNKQFSIIHSSSFLFQFYSKYSFENKRIIHIQCKNMFIYLLFLIEKTIIYINA